MNACIRITASTAKWLILDDTAPSNALGSMVAHKHDLACTLNSLRCNSRLMRKYPAQTSAATRYRFGTNVPSSKHKLAPGKNTQELNKEYSQPVLDNVQTALNTVSK